MLRPTFLGCGGSQPPIGAPGAMAQRLVFHRFRKAQLLVAVVVAALSFDFWPLACFGQEAFQAPLHVAVQGHAIGWIDIVDFIRGLYGNQKTFEIKSIQKAPGDMPPETPYVSYQGREPGSPTIQIIWISTATADSRDEENTQRVGDEYVAATALAVMDAGNAGPTLQALYAQTPNDRRAHLALGLSFAQALSAASDQSAAFAAEQASWIHSHVVPGMTRSAAYELLKTKGLTAYNYSFIKGKPIPPQSDSADNAITGGGCDTSDKSSGAWPYQGEPLPSQEGICAKIFASRPRLISNPDAELKLSGAFNIACSSTTRIVITFTEADRVKAIDIGQPRSTCL